MRRAIGFAAVLVVLLGACSDAPLEGPLGPRGIGTSAAEVTKENVIFPIDLLVFVDCANGGAGELVALNGNLHSVFHVVTNGNRFSVKVHDQPQGIRGVGLSTGDKYQATGVTQERFGGSMVNGQFSDTFVNNFRIIGQGPGNNFLVHDLVHVTFNANGELTAEVLRSSVSCK